MVFKERHNESLLLLQKGRHVLTPPIFWFYPPTLWVFIQPFLSPLFTWWCLQCTSESSCYCVCSCIDCSCTVYFLLIFNFLIFVTFAYRLRQPPVKFRLFSFLRRLTFYVSRQVVFLSLALCFMVYVFFSLWITCSHVFVTCALVFTDECVNVKQGIAQMQGKYEIRAPTRFEHHTSFSILYKGLCI